MHERRFKREIEFLRNPERLDRLEVDRVVSLSLEGLEKVESLLEIGVGSGVFAERFATQGINITGVDVNPEMLEAAQRFVPSGTFREAAAEQLPFEKDAFDLSFMGLVLHETDDALAALREARRVTSGRVVILEWPDEEQSFGPPRSDRLSEDKLSTLARQAGFGKIETTRLEDLVLYCLERK
jgi:ubiquinone/menaquinone biosynthesis C-methylase UbiE